MGCRRVRINFYPHNCFPFIFVCCSAPKHRMKNLIWSFTRIPSRLFCGAFSHAHENDIQWFTAGFAPISNDRSDYDTSTSTIQTDANTCVFLKLMVFCGWYPNCKWRYRAAAVRHWKVNKEYFLRWEWTWEKQKKGGKHRKAFLFVCHRVGVAERLQKNAMNE